MIKARLINSEASLNNFFELDSLSFVPGENVTVAIRIFDSQRDLRLIPPAAAEVTLTFINKDDTELVKVASLIDADDRSMWKVDLSQAETENLAGPRIQIELDQAGDDITIFKTVIPNAMIKTVLSGDC